MAGTVFSITTASLSLAAGQMGPRLLRNFVKDRGKQFTLGAFLGTFSYALMVLRSVRTQGEGPFVPHAALTVGILLAFLCVGVLVYFVGHMAGRINAAVLIRMLEVLTAIAGIERDRARLGVLRRHADLVLGDGERDVTTPADLADLKGRHRRFVAMQTVGPISVLEREAA